MRNSKYNLIVPMSGSGTRFRKEGYRTYKPFIKVNGKCMIDHVLDSFPENINKYFIVNDKLIKKNEKKYLASKSNSSVISIEGHKNGPGYSIFKAADFLPLESPSFIAYNDIYWSWDFTKIEKNLSSDGVIYVHNGFHPHLVNGSFSGFVVAREDRPNLMKDLNVKGAFTDNWMEDEYLDIAVYYIGSTAELVDRLSTDIEKNDAVAGEFFVPSVYKKMVKEGRNIFLDPVDFFIHWGIPAQLENYLTWKKAFEKNDRTFFMKLEKSDDESSRKELEFWNRHKSHLLANYSSKF